MVKQVKSKFQKGEKVCLIAGGAEMTVEDVLEKAPSPEIVQYEIQVLCSCSFMGAIIKMTINQNLLKRCS